MVYSQIFKSQVPQEVTLQLLDKISIKEMDLYWMVTVDKFRQGMYLGVVQEYFMFCVPYYHLSKQHYVNKSSPSYTEFLTVLRQVCNHSGIIWSQNTKYADSTFNIQFKVHIKEMSKMA